jgi:hypothetical protein
MKAKLNKVDNGYVLLVDNIMYATDNDKLSKQNCDEIFGVVDVEKLAEEYDPNYAITDISNGFHFIEGFNKALELNKDKLFTEDDVISAIVHHTYLLHNDGKGYEDGDNNDDRIDYVIEALKQQPTEIEVEIEMEDIIQLKKRAGGLTNMGKPKLDLNGNLILKKL